MSSTPAVPPPSPDPVRSPFSAVLAPWPADKRFGPTHQLIVVVTVLLLGVGLFASGTPIPKVFALLGGCGTIGAATVTAAGGGRRLVHVLIEAAVRAAVDR